MGEGGMPADTIADIDPQNHIGVRPAPSVPGEQLVAAAFVQLLPLPSIANPEELVAFLLRSQPQSDNPPPGRPPNLPRSRTSMGQLRMLHSVDIHLSLLIHVVPAALRLLSSRRPRQRMRLRARRLSHLR
jgi:hypothetical protein